MRIFQDEVEVGVLPDGARCKLSGKNPFDMEDCPANHEYCDGNCFYYTEEPNEGKELDIGYDNRH